MKLTIKTMIINSFKGIDHAKYVFGDRTEIKGHNGSGKTTVADAFFWVFTDKDYSLKSNPEVHPDFLEESEPGVAIVCDVDGREVTFHKFQKDSRTKKQKEDGAPVRVSNQYEINAVPKSQKDFFAYITDLGMDIDRVLLLAHPEIFTAQKSADCRKTLFEMASDVTDKEIADRTPGCEDLGALLGSYTAEEIMAMKKREKKEADENIEAIPNQIIGLEKAKTEFSVKDLTAEKEKLTAEIADIEKAIMDLRVPSMGDLNQQLVLLECEEQSLLAKANADRVEKLTALDLEIGKLKRLISEHRYDVERLKDSITDAMEQKNAKEKRYEDLADEFQKVKASEYDASKGICPTCGQQLPVAMLDQAMKNFEADKRSRMDKINHEAKDCQIRYRELEMQIRDDQAKLVILDKETVKLEEECKRKEKEREPLEHTVSVAGTDEYKALQAQILDVHHRISNRDQLVAEEEEMLANLRARKQEVRSIEDSLAQAKVNDKIDVEIANLKARQKEYAQAKADAERILYQLSIVSMRKNELLTEQVNSHFTRVKFRLFITQKNGEVKDDCTPLVLTDDGTYRDMTFSANTAAIELAKLDIISGLQKFYNQFFPVWADGMECMDSKNMGNIRMDTQLITLSVTDGAFEVICHDKE